MKEQEIRFDVAAHGRDSKRPPSIPEDVWQLLQQARRVLVGAGWQPSKRSYRSELVLLTLLGLRRGMEWSQAQIKQLSTSEIVNLVATEYKEVLQLTTKDGEWAGNTRETVRNQTLNPLVNLGVLEKNTAGDKLPINSQDTAYRVSGGVFEICKSIGSPEWAVEQAKLLEAVERERERARQIAAAASIRVNLDAGGEIELSNGGQNPLIAQILSTFRDQFFPDSHVVYIGDAKEKWRFFFSQELLERFGIELDKADRVPDVILYDEERVWLILVEAVVNGGEIDEDRYRYFVEMFRAGQAGVPKLVFVKAVETMKELRALLERAAWETELWSSDAPEHLIHKDGLHFVTPV